MDGIENPSAELAALKAEFDELREQNADLRGEVQALKQNRPAQQPGPPTVGRRGLLAGGGVGALALLASMGGASAATDPNDGDGDLGTSASPWDTYLDGLALVTEQVSTNTTVTKPVVLYDSALSSLTLTIDASLEGPSGYSQPVVFIDRTGNADTNPVTVNDSGGSAVATIPAANSIFETWWDSGEWVTDRFIPTVDVGTVNIMNETHVAAYRSSTQSITGGTPENVALGSENIDTRNEFDTTANVFSPDSTGWYIVFFGAGFEVGSDGDRISVFLWNDTDSSVVKVVRETAGSADPLGVSGAGLVNLNSSKNYALRVQNQDSNDTVRAGAEETFLEIRSAFE